MRYYELTETKVIKIDQPGEGLDLKVYTSPTRLDIINLLSKYDELRGIITPDGKHYVWDAFKAIHFQIALELGYQGPENSFLADNIESLMFINDLNDVGKSSYESDDWPAGDYFNAGDFFIGGHLSKDAPSLARYITKR